MAFDLFPSWPILLVSSSLAVTILCSLWFIHRFHFSFSNFDSFVRFWDFELNFYFKSNVNGKKNNDNVNHFHQLDVVNASFQLKRWCYNRQQHFHLNKVFYDRFEFGLRGIRFFGKKNRKNQKQRTRPARAAQTIAHHEQREIIPTQCVRRFECKTQNGMILLWVFRFYRMFIFRPNEDELVVIRFGVCCVTETKTENDAVESIFNGIFSVCY